MPSMPMTKSGKDERIEIGGTVGIQIPDDSGYRKSRHDVVPKTVRSAPRLIQATATER